MVIDCLLYVILGQLVGRLRRLVTGKEIFFDHVTTDNCAALRYALARQLNGMSTWEMMKSASRLIVGKLTIAEAKRFIPFYSCLAHELKSDIDYCVKHKVTRLQKVLFLRARAVMQMCCDKSRVEMLVLNFVELLSHRYQSEITKKALQCVLEICGASGTENFDEYQFLATFKGKGMDEQFVCILNIILFHFFQ